MNAVTKMLKVAIRSTTALTPREDSTAPVTLAIPCYQMRLLVKVQRGVEWCGRRGEGGGDN